MQVIFESRNPEAVQLKPVGERHVRQALRRLKWLAPHPRVRLTDANGPRGGIDKRCQIVLGSESTSPVVLTSMARDWRSAFQNTAARAAKAQLHAELLRSYP